MLAVHVFHCAPGNRLAARSDIQSVPNYTDWFLRRPRLWEGHGRRASWSELFFDLIFVAAVAQVGEPLRHDYSFHGLVRYAFLFGLIWWAWNGHTYFHSRFDWDDGLNSVLAVYRCSSWL